MQYLQRHAGGVVVFRNALDSSFILPDYARLTRPSLWSAIVQESIKVWAMTKSTASTWSEVCTLKMNCGFFRMLIQNRSGKLFLGETITCIGSIKRKTNHQPSSSVNCTLLFIYFNGGCYLFVFQIWIVSGSLMLCCRACSSNKSKKYLTARGTGRLVLRMAVNKSSTNFCSVPWQRVEQDKCKGEWGVMHIF